MVDIAQIVYVKDLSEINKDEYYTIKEAKDKLGIQNSARLSRVLRNNNCTVYELKSNSKFVLKKDIENLIEKMNVDEYYTLKEARDKLGIKAQDTLNRLLTQNNCTVYELGFNKKLKYVLKKDIQRLLENPNEIVKDSLKDLFKVNMDECYTLSEAKEELDVDRKTLRKILRKHNCTVYVLSQNKRFVLKKDIQEIKEKRSEMISSHYQFVKIKDLKELNMDEYYTLSEARKELGVEPNTIRKMLKEHNCTVYVLSQSKRFVLKKDIQEIKESQGGFWNNAIDEYYSLIEAIDILGVNNHDAVMRLLKKYNFNIYVKNGSRNFVLKKDILFIKKELDKLPSKPENDREVNIEDLEEINMDDYYNLSEARNILGFKSHDRVKRYLEKYNFNIYVKNSWIKLVLKKDILFIKKELDEVWNNTQDEWVIYKEAYNILGMDMVTFRKTVKELNCKVYELNGRYKYIHKEDILEIKKKRHEFWSNHYTNFYVKEHLNLKECRDIKVVIPAYALPHPDYPGVKVAYKKKEIDARIEGKNKLEIELDKYMTSMEARERLNISLNALVKAYTELGLEPLEHAKKYYFLTSIIDSFYTQQNEMFGKYITTTQAVEKYGEKYSNIRDILWRYLEPIEIPPFCWNLDYGKGIGQESFFIDDEVNNIVSERIKLQQLYNTYGENIHDTFLKRLEFYNDDMPALKNSNYTIQKWKEFALSKLDKATQPYTKVQENKLNRYIVSTIKLNDLLKENNISEIYMANTSQLMMWLNGFYKIARLEMFYFLREIYGDIDIENKKRGLSKGFNIAMIEKQVRAAIKDTSSEENSEIIYDYDTYIKIFEHLINIKLHVKKALKLEKQESIKYLSTWLYAMLHLNNGWRHGDVTRFPRLYIRDILEEWKIDNLEWFKENTISEAQSRRIVARIVQFDYRISKTETYGHFFCSDKLAPSIATAITMLECYCKDNIGFEEEDISVSLMNFGTKYNEPSGRQLKKLFTKINIPNFSFSSKKMNKTVLTLLYNTACAIAPSGYNLLLLPKELRKHIEEMSTIQYLQFSEEQLEFLSGELFERGEFGFITDKLLNLISDKPEKSIDRTSDISNLNALFGDTRKIEAVVGMLNNFENEKEEILNIIMDYLSDGLAVGESFDKCVEVVTNIFMQNLPARQEDIQCLFSETRCKCKDCDKCIDCKYQIPNIYVLRTICLALKEEMHEYIKTPQLGKRIKLSAKIHTKILIFMEAIDKYGKEYVYNCIDMKRDDFMELFNMIPEVEDLLMLQ